MKSSPPTNKRTGMTRYPKKPPSGQGKKAPTPTGAKKNRRAMGYGAATTAAQCNNQY